MDKLISPKEISELLRVSRPWPYVQAKRGKLPFYKIEGLIRFKWTDIEAYLEGCRIEKKG